MNANKLSVKMYDSYCILMFSCYYENIPYARPADVALVTQ